MKRQQVMIVALLLCSQLSFAQEAVKSTLEDQSSVAVTVYNSGLGLVKDTRKISVPAGQGELRFMDVASSIMPVTVSARSLNQPDKFRVLEQNYEYDLMSQGKVLDKYVGKTIKIIDFNQYQDRKDTVEATLLSNEGQIYKIGDEIYLGHPGVKVVPEIPENLISKPTLTWLYANEGSAEQSLEVAYLTNGISWNADYVFSVDANDKEADLSGWVTINNQSGASYNDAKLKVVAGQVNRAQEFESDKMYLRKSAMMAMDAAAPQFTEQAFFEYHIYDLGRATTIKNNQTKQISLLEASGVGLQKEFLVRTQRYFYFQPYGTEDQKQPVEVYITFMNSKANHLGMPLPQGTMRMYKKDKDGSQQFIGEDSIKHTSADEKVRLKAGEAFDLTAERKQTDFKQVTSRDTESEWEITLKNHKEEDVTIVLLEAVSGDWKVISESHPHTEENAFTIRYDIPVPKKGEVKVKYRVSARN